MEIFGDWTGSAILADLRGYGPLVMAYMVMAFIAMAYVVLAHMAMACMVTAYTVMACIGMAMGWQHHPCSSLGHHPCAYNHRFAPVHK